MAYRVGEKIPKAGERILETGFNAVGWPGLRSTELCCWKWRLAQVEKLQQCGQPRQEKYSLSPLFASVSAASLSQLLVLSCAALPRHSRPQGSSPLPISAKLHSSPLPSSAPRLCQAPLLASAKLCQARPKNSMIQSVPHQGLCQALILASAKLECARGYTHIEIIRLPSYLPSDMIEGGRGADYDIIGQNIYDIICLCYHVMLIS
jgi:hypothetical protein